MRKEKGLMLMAMIPVFAILIISMGISVYNQANENFRSCGDNAVTVRTINRCMGEIGD